jgi:hypothetical protein
MTVLETPQRDVLIVPRPTPIVVVSHGAALGGASGSVYFSQTDVVLGRQSSGAGYGEEIPCTSFGRSLIAAANAAAGRTVMNVDVAGTAAALMAARSINTTDGIQGGGNLSADRTLSLTNTGVTAATYGSATESAVIAVDAKGRITSASNSTVTPAWSSITSKPTTLAGFGITDPIVLTSGSYPDPAWITSLAASKLTGTIDPARLPVLPSSVQIVSSGGIADLTAPQQAEIGDGSIVTTTDGRRWVYTGSGSKTSEASYIELADITPEWAVISNKPTTLAGYAISDAQPLDAELTAIAGLTSAADRLPYFTGSGTAALTVLTSFGRNFLDDTDATAGRSTLGLGTMATQNASGVAITGGSIDGTPIGGSVMAAGVFTTLSANINQNGATAIQVNNLAVASGAIARYIAIADSSTVEFGTLSSGWTPNGVFIPSVAYLYNPAAAGITLAAVSGPITFASGSTAEVGRITSTGLNAMAIGGTTPAAGAFTSLSATGVLSIGNTVNAVSPTSPNRTITMSVGGNTYYLHAKTTND